MTLTDRALRRITKPAATLFLKTGTWCNAGCFSCPAGRKEPSEKEDGGTMRPEMLERILDRVELQVNLISVVLHFYNEPTANPYMAELVRICGRRGHNRLMSTNGSYWKQMPEILEAGLENLIFSVSGFTQEIHERSHAGTDIEHIKQCMAETSRIRSERNFVRVGWHSYPYNAHERPLMEDYARSLGFAFTPYRTSLLPLERAIRRMDAVKRDPDSAPDPVEKHLAVKMDEAARLCYDRRHRPCGYQNYMITVDAKGRLHSCSAMQGDHNIRESVFDTCLIEFNERRKKDAQCLHCKSNGYQNYAQQEYSEPMGIATDLKYLARDWWRTSGLPGVFPGISRWWNRRDYTRPQKKGL